VAAGAGLDEATRRAGLAASAVLAIGALPHPFTGLMSDRLGRARLISACMLLSGACSILMGWALAWPFAWLAALGLLYGVLVTAESAVISTGVAEVAEPAHLGRTMALQSMVGFGAGALGPIAFGAVLDAAPRLGASAGGAWMWAWAALGAGALVGPLAVGFRECSRRPAGV
jgi:MFS family permease